MQISLGRGRMVHGGTALAAIAFSMCAAMPVRAVPASGDWPTANRDSNASRYSPLTQITPERGKPATGVDLPYEARRCGGDLGEPGRAAASSGGTDRRARSERTRPGGWRAGRAGWTGGFQSFLEWELFNASETIPLVINGVMYVGTPYARIVALNAATGQQIWVSELPKGVNPANSRDGILAGRPNVATGAHFRHQRRQAALDPAFHGTRSAGFCTKRRGRAADTGRDGRRSQQAICNQLAATCLSQSGNHGRAGRRGDRGIPASAPGMRAPASWCGRSALLPTPTNWAARPGPTIAVTIVRAPTSGG